MERTVILIILFILSSCKNNKLDIEFIGLNCEYSDQQLFSHNVGDVGFTISEFEIIGDCNFIQTIKYPIWYEYKPKSKWTIIKWNKNKEPLYKILKNNSQYNTFVSPVQREFILKLLEDKLMLWCCYYRGDINNDNYNMTDFEVYIYIKNEKKIYNLSSW